MAGHNGVPFRKYVKVDMWEEKTPYYSASEVPLRGTPEWDERENQRAKMGYHVLSPGPIEKGLGHGETMTERQRLALRQIYKDNRISYGRQS